MEEETGGSGGGRDDAPAAPPSAAGGELGEPSSRALRTQSDGTPSVVIAGAGIAGLAAALALRRAGCHATVVERTRSLGAVGAGILVQANGLLVLDALGLGEAVREAGAVRSAFDLRDRHGRLLLRTEFASALPAHLHPVAIHRAELHRILWQACAAAGVAPKLGFAVTKVEADAPRPSLVCDTPDGEQRIVGDLVVGADGIRSVVRDTGGFACATDSPIEGSVQGVAPLELPEEAHGEYFDGGEACGMLPLGNRRTFWFWGGSGRTVEELEGLSYESWRMRVVARFPAMLPVLAGQDGWSGLVRLLHRSVRCERWSRGHVVLIGDAAHAMSPNLGQGANCALVDAWLSPVTSQRPRRRLLCPRHSSSSSTAGDRSSMPCSGVATRKVSPGPRAGPEPVSC